MTSRGLLRLGAAVAGLAAAGAIGFSALEIRRMGDTPAMTGGALEIAEVRTAYARLNAAVDAVGGESLVSMLPEFRRQLADLVAEESRLARLTPGEIDQLNGLATMLDTHFVEFGAAASGDEEALARLSALLAEQGAALGALAAGVRLREETADANRSDALDAVSRHALFALGGAVALLSLLLAVAATSGGGRERAENAVAQAELRAKLAEAEQGRARFVAMMSHELRTPMNGVLGLLALMKESNPTPAMRRLIEQSERAGLQMTGMLGDMLEIECGPPPRAAAADASAEPGQAEPPKAFSLAALASGLKDLFGPVAARNRVDFDVSVAAGSPDRAAGDGRRLQRALAHLVSHVIDKAGVRDIDLRLGHSGEECRAELEFTPPPGGPKAVGLDEISTSDSEAASPLGAHGLGPLLAKGLLESMGGRLEVSTLDSGRVLILAATPSAAIEEPRPRVRVVAQSRSLGALGAAAASAAGVDVLSLDQAPDPDIVLIEAGGAEEAHAAAESRKRWPNAILMALGAPESRAAFDAVIPPPLAPALVSKAVQTAWESQERRDNPDSHTHTMKRSFAASGG